MEANPYTVPDTDNKPVWLDWSIPHCEIQAAPSTPRIYRCPPKIKWEVVSSWIYRVAARYNWSPNTVCKFVGMVFDPQLLDFALTKNDMRRIASLTTNPAASLTSRLARGISKLRASHLLAFTADSDDRPCYRFCAQCLNEDEIPYIRLRWRLVTTVLCERHHLPLADRCMNCSRYLQLNFRNPLILTTANRGLALRYCPMCGKPLDLPYPQSVPHRLAQTLVRFQRLTNQTIAHGSYVHPIHGLVSREGFLEIFFELKRGTELAPQDSYNKWLYQPDYRMRGTHISINWRAVVHPRDFKMFTKLFGHILDLESN